MAVGIVTLLLVCMTAAGPSASQEASPSIFDDGLDSLIRLLERKAMLEAQSLAGDRSRKPGRGIRRPQPELGKRPRRSTSTQEKPSQAIDLSRYLGTEGDQEQAIRRLRQAGKWPDELLPESQKLEPDLFKNIPASRRLDFVSDCLQMGKFQEALTETSYVLATDPDEDHLARALSLRLRALYGLKKYRDAQEIYFRLRSYFPERMDATAALEFLEHESGLDRLQEDVRNNQDDREAHKKLVEAYRAKDWLELAVDFYLYRLPEKTVESYRYLCELHYLLKDWAGLIEASERGIELQPNSPEFYYNRGVGYYHLEGPLADQNARQSFLKARQLCRQDEFKRHIDWYLARLPRTG